MPGNLRFKLRRRHDKRDQYRGDSTETIFIGSHAHPDSLAVSPDGAHLYVGCQGSQVPPQKRDDSVTVINIAARQVVRIIKINDYVAATDEAKVQDLALSPDGTRIYVALERYGLGKIEIDRDYQFSRIDKTGCPEAVVFCRDRLGTRAYVSYQCAPKPGSEGHDPVIVYNAKSD